MQLSPKPTINLNPMINLLGYQLNTTLPTALPTTKTVFNTLNPHSYCVAKADEAFRTALQRSHYLMPDGIGIVWAAKFLKGESIKKIAGFDVFMHLVKQLNEQHGSSFFLGASESTLQKITAKMKVDYPNITVGSYSPPYKAVFSAADSQAMIAAVNAFAPMVLFVGMTAPKQEKWSDEFQAQLQATIICNIGAVFDFYAGNVKRPSKFWINLGLEWLPRLLQEPRRLAKRNFVSTPQFILEVLKYKVGV